AFEDVKAPLGIGDEVEADLAGIAGGAAKGLDKRLHGLRPYRLEIDTRAAPDAVQRPIAGMGAQLSVDQQAEAAVLVAGNEALGDPGLLRCRSQRLDGARMRADQGA